MIVSGNDIETLRRRASLDATEIFKSISGLLVVTGNL